MACKQWNQNEAEKTKFTGTYQNPARLSAKTWTLVQFIEPHDYDDNPRWLFRKQQCLHYTEAVCAQVCPTGAINKLENGTVYINQGICAGCKACVETCPFHIPKFDRVSGTVKKCWLCRDRVENGLKPACVTACPTGAIKFGSRAEILRVARERQQVLANQGYSPRIYGEKELGGQHAVYLLPESATIYDLPENPRKPTEKIIWRWLIGAIPGLAILAGIGRYFFKEEADSEAKVGGE